MSIIPGNTGVAVQFPDGFLVGNGTVTAPTFRFVDATTGFYRPSLNQIALATAGVQSWLVTAAGAHTIGTTTSGSFFHTLNGPLVGAAGIAGLNIGAGNLSRINVNLFRSTDGVTRAISTQTGYVVCALGSTDGTAPDTATKNAFSLFANYQDSQTSGSASVVTNEQTVFSVTMNGSLTAGPATKFAGVTSGSLANGFFFNGPLRIDASGVAQIRSSSTGGTFEFVNEGTGAGAGFSFYSSNRSVLNFASTGIGACTFGPASGFAGALSHLFNGGVSIRGNIIGTEYGVNKLIMDNSLGSSRFYTCGPDTGTVGTFLFSSFSSDSSIGNVIATTSTNGAWTLPFNPVYQARGTNSSYALGALTQIKFQAASGFSQSGGTATANQYTIPATGIYLVIISLSLATATTAGFYIEIRVNGTAVNRITQPGSGTVSIQGTIPIKVNTNDVITLVNQGASGGTVNDNPADCFVSFAKIA